MIRDLFYFCTGTSSSTRGTVWRVGTSTATVTLGGGDAKPFLFMIKAQGAKHLQRLSQSEADWGDAEDQQAPSDCGRHQTIMDDNIIGGITLEATNADTPSLRTGQSWRGDGHSQKVDKEAADKHLSRYCRLSGVIMNRNGFKGRLRLTNAYISIYAASGGRFKLPTGKCPALKAAKSTSRVS